MGDDLPFASSVSTAARTVALGAEGKRCCIMFAALRCGKVDEDEDLLNFTKKTAPHGIGYDDYEVEEDRGCGGTSPKKRRTAEMTTSSLEALKDMAKSISFAAAALSAPATVSESEALLSHKDRFLLLRRSKILSN